MAKLTKEQFDKLVAKGLLSKEKSQKYATGGLVMAPSTDEFADALTDPTTAPVEPVQEPIQEQAAPNLTSQIPTQEQIRAEQQAYQQAVNQQQVNQMGQAFNMQQQGLATAAQAGIQQAQQEAAKIEEIQRLDKEKLDANEAKRVENEQNLAKYELDLTDSIDEYKKTPATIADKFASLSTPRKFLAGIAMILGAAPGSEAGNSAVNQLQRAVDGDIAKAKELYGQKKTIYSEMRDKFQSAEAADAATRLAYLGNMEMGLKQIASKYKGAQIQGNFQQAMGQLEQQKQATLIEFRKAIQASGVGQGSVSQDNVLSTIQRMPKEFQGPATKELAELDKYTKGVSNAENLYKELSQIKAVDTINPWGEGGTKLKAMNASLISAAMSAVKGNPSEGEFARQVAPYLVKSTDTQAQINAKLRGMKQFMELNKEQTPLLDRYGVGSNVKPAPSSLKPVELTETKDDKKPSGPRFW